VTEQYHIRLDKDDLVFSAGHFITYDGDTCERLHGHNYRVTAEICGPLDDNQYVIDFIAVRVALKAIVNELDHHMLLPTTHPLIHVQQRIDEVEVTFQDRRWVFPRGDCILLPVANTTTELLARHIGLRLLDDLEAINGSRPERVRINVDENYGQVAVVELTGE
jgi:6-pyruvoyltetrahydropterin/6-carboxytetrahydropterin synthase